MGNVYNFHKIPENLRRYANRSMSRWSYLAKGRKDRHEARVGIQERHLDGKVSKGFPSSGPSPEFYHCWYEARKLKRLKEAGFGPGDRDEEVLDRLDRMTEAYQASTKSGRPMKSPAPGAPAWNQKEKP